MCTNSAITNGSLMGLLHNQPWLFTASSFCPGDLSNYSLRRASTKQRGLIDSAGSSWWLLHLLFLWLPSAHHTPTALSCSLSRELQTAVKPCIMKLTLLPNPPPSLPLWFFSYIPLPACNPPPPTASQTHSAVAISSRCCGADNSLFYLPLSSTKGPWH